MNQMRTDFENLTDGAKLVLYPNAENPLHKNPTQAVYQSGYFYCKGSEPEDGPDYYLSDVLAYNHGFTIDKKEDSDDE